LKNFQKGQKKLLANKKQPGSNGARLHGVIKIYLITYFCFF